MHFARNHTHTHFSTNVWCGRRVRVAGALGWMVAMGAVACSGTSSVEGPTSRSASPIATSTVDGELRVTNTGITRVRCDALGEPNGR